MSLGNTKPLEILEVLYAGEAKKECLRLKVLEDCNLRDFAIVDLTFDSKGNESNVFRHFFRFPKDKRVEAGDFVRLYTGTGKEESLDNDQGTISHKIYIGSDSTIWNNDGDQAELLWVKTIHKKTVK